MKRSQLDLIPQRKAYAEFGGSLCTKRRSRTARPFSTKHPMHIVLRSSKAKGTMSLRHHSRLNRVNKLFGAICREHGVKVHEYANVGNHIHALVKIPNRRIYARWVRKLTARIACLATGARKGKSSEKFWDFRPYTRIVIGWKGFKIAKDYVYLNHLEAIGVVFRKTSFQSTA